MSDKKLTSEEVPGEFAEWLLTMGCPPEIVPSVEKVSQICRGQYYMVWWSMMEHVQPKDTIRNKRMQVFCDDIRKCQKRNVFNELESNAVVPEQLAVWREHKLLSSKVNEMESKIKTTSQNLNQSMEKVSNKMFHRNTTQCKVDDARRRSWLMQQVAEDLRSKKTNLEETRSIADSLCSVEEVDIQEQLDKCIAVVCRQMSHKDVRIPGGVNPVASSSLLSTKDKNNDTEEHLSNLVKYRGDVLWAQLLSRRASLNSNLAKAATKPIPVSENRSTPQSVLAHTAAFHCTLALETMKSRMHIKHMTNKLADSIADIDNLNPESCELLVLRCERARADARVNTLKVLLDDMRTKRGIFSSFGETDGRNTGKMIADIDKSITSKRDELKSTINSILLTERKIEKVREYLQSVFNGFNKERAHMDISRIPGVQIDMPQESIALLTRFYQEKRESRKSKVELSFNLELSNCSYEETYDVNNPRFIDELRIYLKRFNLARNRKLVLDSGEKNWSFETLQSSVQRYYESCTNADISCSLICPSITVSSNLSRLIQEVRCKKSTEDLLTVLNRGGRVPNKIDISQNRIEEEEFLDKIKKSLKENMICLQRTDKALEIGMENLRLWFENQIKKYISTNRTVNGKIYKDIEAYYVESLAV